MLIEQPPILYRLLFPEAAWRIKRRARKIVYLTLDDGPIPETTPWILDLLDRENIKATFFMVGDNVRKYPELFEEIKRCGHSYGNHTMHHIQGMKTPTKKYLRDILEADDLIDSCLFRPPHGLIRWSQSYAIRQHYNLVMYDVITRDYNPRLSPEDVLNNVKKYVRNGSIIVFHDSIKAWPNMSIALPAAIAWLKEQGYEFCPIQM